MKSLSTNVFCIFNLTFLYSIPYKNSSTFQVDPIAPVVVFGCVFFVVGIIQIFLPETNDKKLANTIDEGKEFLMKNMPINCKNFAKSEIHK